MLLLINVLHIRMLQCLRFLFKHPFHFHSFLPFFLPSKTRCLLTSYVRDSVVIIYCGWVAVFLQQESFPLFPGHTKWYYARTHARFILSSLLSRCNLDFPFTFLASSGFAGKKCALARSCEGQKKASNTGSSGVILLLFISYFIVDIKRSLESISLAAIMCACVFLQVVLAFAPRNGCGCFYWNLRRLWILHSSVAWCQRRKKKIKSRNDYCISRKED